MKLWGRRKPAPLTCSGTCVSRYELLALLGKGWSLTYNITTDQWRLNGGNVYIFVRTEDLLETTKWMLGMQRDSNV